MDACSLDRGASTYACFRGGDACTLGRPPAATAAATAAVAKGVAAAAPPPPPTTPSAGAGAAVHASCCAAAAAVLLPARPVATTTTARSLPPAAAPAAGAPGAHASLYFVGLALGGIGFGAMSDRHGRRTCLYCCAAVAAAATVGEALAPAFWLHALCRLAGATAVQGMAIAD
ncbi:hypothetical protein TSOC_013340, partial [Tetrabaena socialis]